jgi:putative peptidoglycan lipid II flippase
MAPVRDSLARDVATVGAATLLSRLLGFARDLGVAALLGAGAVSDAFFVAMLIPNLFRRLLAEGALNSAFVPAWMRVRAAKGASGAQQFGEEVMGTMLLVLGSLVLLCTALAPTLVHLLAPGFTADEQRLGLAATYLRIVLPYVTIAGLIAVAAAALNAERRVAAVSFGLIVYNAVALAALGLIAFGGVSLNPGIILSAAVVLAGIAQVVLVGTALVRLSNPPIHPRLVQSLETRRFFALALPGIIAAGIPQLKLIAGAMVASSSQNAVSWLYYAYRLYELPLGVISVAIASVMSPVIAAGVRTGKATDAQSRALELALGLALPAAIGIGVLAKPIAESLFEHGAFGPRDTAAVAGAIAGIAAGLPGHALEKVLGSISFAREDTQTPMAAALSGLVAAVAGALALFPLYGHIGVAIAIAGSGWIGALVLGIVLFHRGWLTVEPALSSRLGRITLTAIAMGAAICLLQVTAGTGATSSFVRLAALIVFVTVGVAVYMAGLQVLGVARIRDLLDAIRAKT